MCIAILNTAETIDKEIFENCWYSNPDGAGIAYVEGSEIKIIKEMESVHTLYKKYVEIRHCNDSAIIVHFRIATSGQINEDNCHPFEVKPGLVMAHNGIIDQVDPTDQINDTRVFINEVLSQLPEHFLYNDAILRLIGGFINESKLVFLDNYGMYHIVNGHLGHWDDDHKNWFSNYSYFDDFRFSKYSQYSLSTNESDYCECCGRWYEITLDAYDIGVDNICPTCIKWYMKDDLIEH